jgi:hypothetical protein
MVALLLLTLIQMDPPPTQAEFRLDPHRTAGSTVPPIVMSQWDGSDWAPICELPCSIGYNPLGVYELRAPSMDARPITLPVPVPTPVWVGVRPTRSYLRPVMGGVLVAAGIAAGIGIGVLGSDRPDAATSTTPRAFAYLGLGVGLSVVAAGVYLITRGPEDGVDLSLTHADRHD